MRGVAALAAFAAPLAAAAGGGPLGIDNPVDADDATGPLKRSNQKALQYATIAVVLGSALWDGSDTRYGRTAWQATDAMAIGAITAEVMKVTFSRSRPSQSSSPNEWFQGSGHRSFPSGEVMLVTTAVVPFILEYQHDEPAVWALAALPVYDAVARVRSQAHWQTDVLASLAIGSAIGYYTHERAIPISVGLLPREVTIGWKKSF
jgi:PAP2 superfamily